MKTCVLHINERLKEGNRQEQRFVVVVFVVLVFQLVLFCFVFLKKTTKSKAKLTQNIIPIVYEVIVSLFEFSV